MLKLKRIFIHRQVSEYVGIMTSIAHFAELLDLSSLASRFLAENWKAPKVLDCKVPEGDEGESEEQAEASAEVCHLQMKVIWP